MIFAQRDLGPTAARLTAWLRTKVAPGTELEVESLSVPIDGIWFV
jgi:hypothetical protein